LDRSLSAACSALLVQRTTLVLPSVVDFARSAAYSPSSPSSPSSPYSIFSA
jgi:hypothetical protein